MLHKSIVDLLDKEYELVMADYRDSFEDRPVLLQQAIRNQDSQCLYEDVKEWEMDARDIGMDYALDNLKDEISRAFDVEDWRAAEFIEKYREEIENIIYDRYSSTVVEDMIRHTPDQPAFYDTGFEVYEGAWCDSDYAVEALKGIKKALKIPAKVKTWDENIQSMIANASYGGMLVVYWYADISDLMKIGHPIHKNAANTIRFKNPMIALIDTCNGSGDHIDLEGWEFSLPLNLDNIFIDKTVKYNYTFAVCSMYPDWCSCTRVTFEYKRQQKDSHTSALNAAQEREKQLQETFNKGSCTPFDMDIHRHRHLFYINDFPCGTKCRDCGTFWID